MTQYKENTNFNTNTPYYLKDSMDIYLHLYVAMVNKKMCINHVS